MRTLVRFQTEEGIFSVPVESVVGVRAASDLTSLPDFRARTAGALPSGEGSLAVLATFGTGDEHVLILKRGSARYGLWVQRVLGISRVPETAIGPAPPDPARGLASEVRYPDGTLDPLLDVEVLSEYFV